jgi:hypothetical protein
VGHVTGGPAVLVVTGAAAAGKSTVGAALSGRSGLLVLDGDVLAAGSTAAAHRDYHDFWRYLLSIAAEVHRNGLTPVYPCICLPDQVLAAEPAGPVHFLALVNDDVRGRITRRPGSRPSIDLDFHQQFDTRLRGCSVDRPHTLTRLDTTHQAPEETARAGWDWVDGLLDAAG